MNIFKKIRIKWHNDIFDILSILKEKIDFLIHGHEQSENKVTSVIDKIVLTTERLNKIDERLEKLNQVDGALAKLDLLIAKRSITDELLSKIANSSEKLNQMGGALAKLNLLIAKRSIADELLSKIANSSEKLNQMDRALAKLDLLITKQSATNQLISKYGEEIATNSNSIFSYCNNEMIKQSDGFKMTDIYEYYKKLHALTTLYNITTQGVKKTRIGRKHDGGYVMIEPFSSTKIAYSLGIADDISWDDAMADYGYNIYQYDHTIEKLPKERKEFHWKKLGLTGCKETENLKHLNTLIHDNGHDNCLGMLLKMDIENYEWDVLNNTNLDTLNRFDQIVMEIHGLNNLNQSQRTIEVLEKLSQIFTTVHIHANNFRYSAFCDNYITPDVLEITMVKTSLYDYNISTTACMSTIDQVNRPNSQDVWILKW